MNAPDIKYYLPGLHGLRAIAAFSVFISNMRHIVPIGGRCGMFDIRIFVESGVGVAFFFVLSGYLLTLSFWKAPELWKPFKNPVQYLFQRVTRLYPLYFICLSGLVIYQKDWQTIKDIQDIVLHFLMLHNLFEFSFYSISSPLWTIPIQAQFYFCLPFFMLLAYLLGGRSHKRIFIVLIIFSGLCYIVTLFSCLLFK